MTLVLDFFFTRQLTLSSRPAGPTGPAGPAGPWAPVCPGAPVGPVGSAVPLPCSATVPGATGASANTRREATGELLELIPEPFAADPGDVLVATGVATRPTWYRHAHLAPYMAASPEADDFTANALALMANRFERLGLEGEEAAACFHTYASFMIGSVLFAAARKVANEQLDGDREDGRVYLAEADVPTARKSSKETHRSLDEVMGLDEQRDEDLFADGLRRLVESFRPGAPGA